MNRLLKLAATMCLVGFGLAASAPVFADHWHGRGGVGFYFGVPLFAPYYPGSYYYGYPPVGYVPPAAPTAYVERGDVQAPAQAAPQSQQLPPPVTAGNWYFCADSNAYYPYVKNCPSAWQRVAPQPPSASR